MPLDWKKTEYGNITEGTETKQFCLELHGLTEEQCNECLRVLKITTGVEKPEKGMH